MEFRGARQGQAKGLGGNIAFYWVIRVEGLGFIGFIKFRGYWVISYKGLLFLGLRRLS